MRLKSLMIFFVMLLVARTLPVLAEYSPHFLIDSADEWTAAWEAQHIAPLNHDEWDRYIKQWTEFLEEGKPYPEPAFSPPELFIWPGRPAPDDPDNDVYADAGLVMVWGTTDDPAAFQEDGSKSLSSAWKYDYGEDPDLSAATIKVTVTPPASGYINAISFAIQDVNGNIRSWWWSVPGTIPHSVPTTITINTALTGLTAATPAATGYASNPAFDITKAQAFLADENGNWVGGPVPVPPFGTTVPGFWNYWHNLIVMPNTSVYKGYYLKWSQPPVEIEKGLVYGWDERSVYWYPYIVADDWECKDNRPVTDIHWWGSFIGWTQPYLPPDAPKRFHIGIWTDVPATAARPSHPGRMIWQNFCSNFVWNFAGYDRDPRGEIRNEACFQFNQLLSQNEWFYQKRDPTGKPTIYWLSIAAIYDDGVDPIHPWGWKTRPHHFNDDAVRIFGVISADNQQAWPPQLGAVWSEGEPIEFAQRSWDLAFELSTNRRPLIVPDDIAGDFDGDGRLGLADVIGILQVLVGIR